MTLLDKTTLQNLLTQTVDEAIHIDVFESLSSTNTYLKEHRVNDGIQICLAEQQTQGKGRLGRTWHSPFGKNIYLSMAYRFSKNISELSGLSLVVGLAILRSLNEFGLNDTCFVKWPNDVLCDEKKIAGTLIELDSVSKASCDAIIGIGINVNMSAEGGKEISQAWNSMQTVLGERFDRNMVTASLMKHLIAYLKQFEKSGLMAFISEWSANDYLFERDVTIKLANEEIEGKVVGINVDGHLQLCLADGTIRAFSSGDASIKKKA